MIPHLFYKIVIFVYCISLFISCLSEPEGFIGIAEAEIPELTILNPNNETILEGITWFECRISDKLGSEHKINIYYNEERVGYGTDYATQFPVKNIPVQLSTFLLPESVTLKFVSEDESGNKDEKLVTVKIAKREMTEFLGRGHGGVLPDHRYQFLDGNFLSNGAAWIVTGHGLLIINKDLSIEIIEYNDPEATNYSKAILYHMVDVNGDIFFIDTKGKVLIRNGNNFIKIGQIEKRGEYNFDKVISFNNELWAIHYGAVIRYKIESNKSEIYELLPSHFRGTALAVTPENGVLAAFNPTLSGAYAKLFHFKDNNWEEIPLPKTDQFDDYNLGKVTDIVVDKTNRIWLGRGRSLLLFNEGSFTSIALPGPLYSVGASTFCGKRGKVSDLCISTNGDLWIAAHEGGLIKYDFETFSIYPTPTLSNKHTSCGSGGTPYASKVIVSTENEIIVLSEGSSMVITHLSTLQ